MLICPQAINVRSAMEQIELMAQETISSRLLIFDVRRVTLPRLMRLYGRDFGGRDGQLAFAARYLSAVRDCRERSGAVSVRYGRFDWTAADSPT